MPAQKKDRRRGGQSTKDGTADEARSAARAERTAVFGKTKLCKFFILGCCTKGKDCCFAHDQSEMNPTPDLSRTKICKTLINTGACNDPDCTYAHNKDELRDMPTVDPAPKKLTESSGRNSVQQQKVSSSATMGTTSVPQDHTQAMLMQQQQQLQQMMALQMMSQMQSQMNFMMAQQTDTGKAPSAPQFQNSGFSANQLLLQSALGLQQQQHKQPAEKLSTNESSKAWLENPNHKRNVQPQIAAPTNEYNVKNTFVDIEDPIVAAAKRAGVRNWQSATELNTYCDESPVHASQQEMSPQMVEDGVVKPKQNGLSALVPTLSQSNMRRINTWASDLGKVEEESPRDDFLDIPTDGLNAPSEKRLQDTPFAEMINITDSDSDFRKDPAMECIGDGIKVKNTFLQFEPPRTGGMRMVQTASGRLDMLGME